MNFMSALGTMFGQLGWRDLVCDAGLFTDTVADNSKYPQTFCNLDGSMRKTDKAQLGNCLESEVEAKLISSQPPNETEPERSALLVEACVL